MNDVQLHLRAIQDDLWPVEWFGGKRREWGEHHGLEPTMPSAEVIQKVRAFGSDRELRDWIQNPQTPAEVVIALYQLYVRLHGTLNVMEDEPQRRAFWESQVRQEWTARHAFAVAWRFSQDAGDAER